MRESVLISMCVCVHKKAAHFEPCLLAQHLTAFSNFSVKIVLERLGLFDILTEEMAKINEEERLCADSSLTQPKPPPKKASSTESEAPQTVKYVSKNVFKPSVSEDKANPGIIEELEEREEKRRRPGGSRQQRIDEMQPKRADTSLPSPDLDVSFGTLLGEVEEEEEESADFFGKNKRKKSQKRKQQNEEETHVADTQPKKKSKRGRPRGTSMTSTPGPQATKSTLESSQIQVDRAMNDLLDDLEDFESTKPSLNVTSSSFGKVPFLGILSQKNKLQTNRNPKTAEKIPVSDEVSEAQSTKRTSSTSVGIVSRVQSSEEEGNSIEDNRQDNETDKSGSHPPSQIASLKHPTQENRSSPILGASSIFAKSKRSSFLLTSTSSKGAQEGLVRDTDQHLEKENNNTGAQGNSGRAGDPTAAKSERPRLILPFKKPVFPSSQGKSSQQPAPLSFTRSKFAPADDIDDADFELDL